MRRVREDEIFNFWLSGLKEEVSRVAENFFSEEIYQLDEPIEDERHLKGLLSDAILNAIENDIYETTPESVLVQFGNTFILEKEGSEVKVDNSNVYNIIPEIIKKGLQERGKTVSDLADEFAVDVMMSVDIENVIEEANRKKKNRYPRMR